MRYLLLVLMALGCSTGVMASERQFSVNKCAALEAERAAIQAKMRSGYDVSEYNFLNGREMKLFQIQARHCLHPVPDEQAAAAYLAPERAQRLQQQTQSPQNFPMMQANNAVFTGAMAKAWDNFYQMPVQCRIHQQSAEDFVYCAEDKLRQRQAFLLQWQQHEQQLTQPVTRPSVAAQTEVFSPSAAVTPPPPQAFATTSPHTAYVEPERVPRHVSNRAQWLQFSGLGLGALVMFLWMSWWLWRR